MLFRDVKQGYPVYVFDRKEVAMSVGKVTNAPLPHFDMKVGSGKMVVDLNIEIDGKTTSYVFDDTAEIGYAGDKVISVNKEAVLREVERVKNQSEDALKMTDYHKSAVEKCNELLKEYSQEYRERSENNERMDALEGKMESILEKLERLTSSRLNG